ncbi:uncharacterized protein TNCV_1377341 [Trichonephila clavipes]|nr:uncharacterized protein TNCV_1377341 [Trichonephila clavipes]
MPGKRARRHFSQLSEFERGLIIGMKTAGWSTRRVAGQVGRSECAVRNCWEQWTREGTHARKTGMERPGRPRGLRLEPTTPKAQRWNQVYEVVIANAKRIGSCKRLNGISESEGIIGIRDRNTTLP